MSESSQTSVAVVIPAINERSNLELLIPAVRQTLTDLGVPHEIVVVDGGSHDGTSEAAERVGARVIGQTEKGYGGALLAGFAATTAPYVVTMDADLSHRPAFLEDFWKRRDDAELLIASRYVEGGKADMARLRRLMSGILNRVYARVLAVPVRDLSSGFRMYRRRVLPKEEMVARDFDFLEEILIRILNLGYRVTEVPFHYMARGSGHSKSQLIKFGKAFLKTLFRMWRLRNSVESADYDYRAYDSPIWLQRYWQRTRHKIILGFLDSQDSILDIGCGSSRIILDLPNAVGLDILHYKLRWLRPRHNLTVLGSCDLLPHADASFDTVICSQVIEHIVDKPQILGEMGRVLRADGTLILGTPDYGRWIWRFLEAVYDKILPDAYVQEHITHFTHKELSERLCFLGYDILDCKYVGYGEMIFKARKTVKVAQPALESPATSDA